MKESDAEGEGIPREDAFELTESMREGGWREELDVLAVEVELMLVSAPAPVDPIESRIFLIL